MDAEISHKLPQAAAAYAAQMLPKGMDLGIAAGGVHDAGNRRGGADFAGKGAGSAGRQTKDKAAAYNEMD